MASLKNQSGPEKPAVRFAADVKDASSAEAARESNMMAEMEAMAARGVDPAALVRPKVINNTEGPEEGRLDSHGAIVSRVVENDDTYALWHWLADASTHVDDTTATKQQTLLILTARSGSHRCLKLLVGAGGADVEATGEHGATALYVAAQEGQTRCLLELIAADANLDTPVATGANALFISAVLGREMCATILLDAGADPNHDAVGETAFEGAIKCGFFDIARELLQRGGRLAPVQSPADRGC